MTRVLVVAYACAPRTGSEPGVGWNWIAAMARRGWQVTAVTSAVNHLATQEYLDTSDEPWAANVTLVPVGTAKFQAWLLRSKGLTYPYQLLWQWAAYRAARREVRARPHDAAHNLTYGGIRIPTFLGLLGLPLILGPLGGGETAPMRFIWPLGRSAIAKELLRGASNLLVRISPLSLLRFVPATRILAKTGESAKAIGRQYAAKTRLVNDVGTRPIVERPVRAPAGSEPRLLFAGRFLYWKGGELALRGFAEHVRRGGAGVLEMIGSGPCADRWRAVADELGLGTRVEWTEWLPQADFLARLSTADAFLFPSLHDSSGNVVYEALSLGTPVICLDLGGPGLILRRLGFAAVPVEGASPAVLAGRIADAVATVLGGGSDQLQGWDRVARYFESNRWDDLVSQAYDGLLA